MKIPKSIRIAGHDVRVRQVKSIQKNTFLGEADHVTNTIYIAQNCHNKKVAKDQIIDTLLHEILHHLDDKLKIGLGEKKVTLLSAGLFQVLSDNNIDFRKKRG